MHLSHVQSYVVKFTYRDLVHPDQAINVQFCSCYSILHQIRPCVWEVQHWHKAKMWLVKSMSMVAGSLSLFSLLSSLSLSLSLSFKHMYVCFEWPYLSVVVGQASLCTSVRPRPVFTHLLQNACLPPLFYSFINTHKWIASFCVIDTDSSFRLQA